MPTPTTKKNLNNNLDPTTIPQNQGIPPQTHNNDNDIDNEIDEETIPPPVTATRKNDAMPNPTSLQTTPNIDLTNKFAVIAMQQLCPKEWKEFGFKQPQSGVLTGQSAKGTQITIEKNKISFTFNNADDKKDVVRKAARLLLAVAKPAKGKVRIPVSFSGSDQAKEIFNAVFQEAEFKDYFEVEGATPQSQALDNSASNLLNKSLPNTSISKKELEKLPSAMASTSNNPLFNGLKNLASNKSDAEPSAPPSSAMNSTPSPMKKN